MSGASLIELRSKNESLKAALKALQPESAESAAISMTEAQRKAQVKLDIIEKEKKSFELGQAIEKLELQAQHLLAEAKNKKSQKKDLDRDIDETRNAGKPIWESTGRSTISYMDPYHTGLSKRTPTGTCRPQNPRCTTRLRVFSCIEMGDF